MADVESAKSVAERAVMLATTRGVYSNDEAIAAVLRQWREDIRREALEEAARWCDSRADDLRRAADTSRTSEDVNFNMGQCAGHLRASDKLRALAADGRETP